MSRNYTHKRHLFVLIRYLSLHLLHFLSSPALERATSGRTFYDEKCVFRFSLLSSKILPVIFRASCTYVSGGKKQNFQRQSIKSLMIELYFILQKVYKAITSFRRGICFTRSLYMHTVKHKLKYRNLRENIIHMKIRIFFLHSLFS